MIASALRRFVARLARFVRPGRADADLEREVAAHLGVMEDDYRRNGLSANEARVAARRALGGVDRAKELHRDARSFAWLEDVRRDVKYAGRALARARGFTTVVVLTLAIGIGATTATFAALSAVLIRPLPFRDADRLVYVSVSNSRFTDAFKALASFGGGIGFPPSNADFEDLQRATTSFSDLMTFSAGSVNLEAEGHTDVTGGVSVRGGYFEVLGVGPALGRAIGPGDDRQGSEPVAVISHRLWRSAFHESPTVLNRAVTVDGRRHRVVGVMPAGFLESASLDPTDYRGGIDVWTAMRLTAEARAERNLPDASATIGRLRDGVTFAQARAETETIINNLDRRRSPEWQGWYASTDWVRESSIRSVRKPLWLLFAAVALLMLVACANVAHLFLTRAIARAHELQVRAALGAGRRRLMQQLLTEAAVLVVGGTVLGLVLAALALRWLPLVAPADVPRLNEASLDWRVVTFSVGLSALTVALFGVLPSLTASRRAVAPVIRHVGAAAPRSRRVRQALIVGQVAVALVLLTGASLLIRSYGAVRRLDPGFSTSTLTMTIALTDRYVNQVDKRREFHRRLLAGIRALPGVDAVGAVNTLPLTRTGSMSTIEIEGRPRSNDMVDTRTITGDYFDAIGTPLLSGRLLSETDGEHDAKVVVVNRAFERRFFPGESALGRKILPSTPEWRTIVGVVADVRHDNLEGAPRAQVYSATIHPLDGMFIAIRSRVPPDTLVPEARRLVRNLDAALGVGNVQTMADRVSESISVRRFQTMALAAFGLTAVAVAMVGLFGLLTYSVRQRTGEIGIRIALGATVRDVWKLVLGEGLTLTLVGIGFGFAGAFAVTRFLQSLLYGVGPTDATAFACVAFALAIVGAVASYVPARRAAKVDPIIALRSE